MPEHIGGKVSPVAVTGCPLITLHIISSPKNSWAPVMRLSSVPVRCSLSPRRTKISLCVGGRKRDATAVFVRAILHPVVALWSVRGPRLRSPRAQTAFTLVGLVGAGIAIGGSATVLTGVGNAARATSRFFLTGTLGHDCRCRKRDHSCRKASDTQRGNSKTAHNRKFNPAIC